MKTTLKRGVGRATGLNGKDSHDGTNGHAVFPPSTVSSVVRYQQPRPSRTRVGLFLRFLLGTLVVLSGIGLAIAGGAFLFTYQQVSDLHARGAQEKIAETIIAKQPVAPGHAAVALVVGYDHRVTDTKGTPSRSDTIMLIRADPVTKTISLLSFPRDLTVPIWCPGTNAVMRQDRINSAYASCGPNGTLDTVRHLIAPIPINYMITVNFHGFKEVVDKLGGVWMDVDRRYYHVNNGTVDQNYANINIQPGYQLLTGGQALDFVRYRHTDDDYHRVARQQEFVRALKQQLGASIDVTKLPSLMNTITHNVLVYGKFNLGTVKDWAWFAANLPGGHFFQDKIEGITGVSNTYASASSMGTALHDFTNPDVGSSKVANAAALGLKIKPKVVPPPAEKTTVTVLNGNGVAGSAADGAYLLRQKGYVTVLPPNNLSPNAPTQGYFQTTIYYDKTKDGAKLAAAALHKLIVPSLVEPLPKSPALRALNPGSMLMVAVGQTFHNKLFSPAPTAPAPKHQQANVRYDGSSGLALLQPYIKKAGFKLEVPTILDTSSQPDNQYGDVASRMYWIDGRGHHKAIRLVFRTYANEYWGIEETDMPNPPILRDRSFQRAIKGREFQLYYSGSSLQMVVLRVHDRSYWVINTLLDSLSNETMLAIAKGLKPLAEGHS